MATRRRRWWVGYATVGGVAANVAECGRDVITAEGGGDGNTANNGGNGDAAEGGRFGNAAEGDGFCDTAADGGDAENAAGGCPSSTANFHLGPKRALAMLVSSAVVRAQRD